MSELPDVTIRKFLSVRETEAAARLIMGTDPWKTFGRTFENCLDAVTNLQKESYGVFLNDNFLGVLVIDLTGPFKGYIQAVCIHPDFRRMGLGTQLIRFAEDRIFSVSPNCFLCFSDFNPSVQPMYERLGYELIAELKDYMIIGHSEFLMRKTIGPVMSFMTKSSS